MTGLALLDGVRVVVGVTGGIAAYKATGVVRLLRDAGADVEVVMTDAATHFVGPVTFEGLTGRVVRTRVWDEVHAGAHVMIGQQAQAVLVYPATANTLARMAGGLADDLLTNVLLATRAPVVVAPAMHTEMFEHPATQANLDTLRGRGVRVVGPAAGALMGGDVGPGRVVEPEEAVAALVEALKERVASDAAATADTASSADTATADTATADTASDRSGPTSLAGRRVVVTAGGTREPVDPVRYLGNRSSGKMGFAVAARAAALGAEVDLVAAPTALPTPPGVRRHDVTTACELHRAVLGLLDAAPVDVVVKAAAVADFRPANPAAVKLKKEQGAPVITLVPNPDVLAELGERRRMADAAAGGRLGLPVLVGFAAETDHVEVNGRAKLAAKGADLLVVNDVSATDAGFEVDTNRVVLLNRDGGREEVALTTKAAVATRILDVVADLLADRTATG